MSDNVPEGSPTTGQRASDRVDLANPPAPKRVAPSESAERPA